MQNKIKLAMRACVDNSPSRTAKMMKFHDGNLITYGGTFCVKIPCGVDVDCAFLPDTLLTFFRKERTNVTYAVSKNRLVVKQGREKVMIPCLSGSEMPIIDVFKEPTPVTKFLKRKALKSLIECIDPASDAFYFQGLCLRKGLAMATDRKAMLAMVSGLPKKVHCVLPIDALKFLATVDDEVTGVAFNEQHIKFVFTSGMTMCSRIISADEVPDVRHIINAEGETISLHPDLLEELKGIKSHAISVTESGIGYKSEDGKSFGDIELKTKGSFAFSVNKRQFDLLMSLTIDNKITISSRAVHANGKKFFRMALVQNTMQRPHE